MFRRSSLLCTAAIFAVALAGVLEGQAPQAQAPGEPAAQGRQGGPGGPGGRGGRGRGQVQLPEGAGREAVQATCGACHGLNQIAGSAGYTQQQWRDLMNAMVTLPAERETEIASYLATHFPPRPGREPKLVAGPVQVRFQEWMVPTKGQRPRDPVMAADGNIYWNGQGISIIGQLNPRTGEMREWRLDPESRPHSINPDAQGNIWYMGNGNGTIGKLDPRTGDIQVYKMPDPMARDPHTGVWHPNGNLYFTMQQSQMMGRLDPRTGEIRVVRTLTERANPYGIKFDQQGRLWASYNASNRIARMDPNTMEIREYELPDPMSRSRRLVVASDGMIYFVNSALGRIGRLNPDTGEVKEWPSPSGAQSHPYAIEIIDDIIWYNESNQRPDALVRFDPRTETFQSWAIPSGVGIIRHMRATPDGDLVIHQGSTNRIGLVTITEPR